MKEEEINQNTLIRTIEIYENERYQLSAMGWSANGLLPTDRKNISTKDGKLGWTSMELASQSLISRGWVWADEWKRECIENITDNDGWSYATNFGNIEQCSPVKTMSHFVRRRKFIRHQAFVLPSAIIGTCDHCDLQEVQSLSAKLLDTLTDASLHENAGTSPSDIVSNSLKDEMLTFLGIGRITQSSSSTVTLNPLTIPSDFSIDLDPSLDFLALQNRLQRGSFVAHLQSKKSAWGKAASIFSSDGSAEKFPLRAAQLDSGIFTSAERRIVAECLIRAYDKNYQYHCDEMECGDTCQFSRHECPHDGCTAIYSLKWKDNHDAICPYIIIPCPRECGVEMARRNIDTHLAETCLRRPAECPYHAFGCSPPDLTAGILEEHIQTAMGHHLLLVTNRVAEEQNVIVKLHKRIAELEENQSRTSSTITTIQTSLAALTIAVAAAERSADNKKPIENLEKKLEKEISSVSREVSQVKSSVQNLDRNSNTVVSRITAIEARLPPPQPPQQASQNQRK